jgi:hypothetical protein
VHQANGAPAARYAGWHDRAGAAIGYSRGIVDRT